MFIPTADKGQILKCETKKRRSLEHKQLTILPVQSWFKKLTKFGKISIPCLQ